MKSAVKEIKVGLDFGTGIQNVGRLAIHDSIIYFEYDQVFLEKNLEISPLKLPLQPGVIELPKNPFEGLPGIFNDSLPDGWGRLLFDRFLLSKGISISDISALDRLAYVGLNGLGALVYEPDQSLNTYHEEIDLDILAAQTQEVLQGHSEEVLKELLALNGSSAGARPKALIGVDPNKNNIIYGSEQLKTGFEHWIVKFPNSLDGMDSGAVEYVYSLMAKDAGIEMPTTHLFPSQKGNGYFAVQRFDRDTDKRYHMHTASGLLHNNFRFPSLDYEDLITLTNFITKDIREVEKIFRLAVFNVMSHNRDDHSKNFSFLMNENGKWALSPAYDLTFSSGPGGEQSTMVLGEGRNITTKHLRKLGLEAKLPKGLVEDIIEQTHDALSKWIILSKNFEISKAKRELIQKAIIK